MHTHSHSRGGILLTSEILRLGEQPRQVQRLQRAGSLQRLRRGVFVDAEKWVGATPRSKYLLRLRAVAATRIREPVFSHASAAAIHGLPLLHRQMLAAHISSDPVGRSRNGVIRHRSLPGRTAELIDGLWCTSLADTLADLALTSDLAAFVVPADHALHRVARDALLPGEWAVVESTAAGDAARAFSERVRESILATGRTRGLHQALRSLAFATHLADSPGESVSRCTIHLLGFPAPELQHPFHDEDGFIGWSDFWWPGQQVAGESDGEGKYLDPAILQGRTTERALVDEKWREDRIRNTGARVVRWDWATARDPKKLHARLFAAGLRLESRGRA
ncbi:hypothetical protein FB562_1657 [Homoserinimonas aerilata]|uniref:Transcriptional regulator, AbiEi antitoxin, Type IV TA system n=1 Tax=Homoserinimonas aerilata TaxID=1162970 RepID=A0A542YKG8_9MICO|nr:type IV toxin-antitoxin system AbiEi family antitoxin domain-containing protein [Homoserinimonas aerilata]TQL48562.1 hypothetical protein FB562_1657 [Homoserinimonas aerilata]